MKDSLFEMLMSFFEKSLAQLKETTLNEANDTSNDDEGLQSKDLLLVRTAKRQSIRVFTALEQCKLTKASYQFLMRLISWEILSSEIIEQILNQLLLSESRFVNLQETKWTIRHFLVDILDSSQLAFLDLVLYQKEDELPLH